MEIKKLLFVTKFDDLSFYALQSLLTLRQAALNHVVFVNVIEREKVGMRRGLGYQKSEEIRLREVANIRFIDWAETLFEQGLEVGVYIVVGNLVSQVFESARKEEADLIVIGRPHKHFMDQLYTGSDVIEILRRARIPVLVYKPIPDKIDVFDRPFERPLLATDGSPASRRAEDYLRSLSSLIKEMHVVEVVPEKMLTGDSSLAIQRTRKEARARLEEVCERMAAAGIDAREHVYIGNPELEIERAARDLQASLIFMGSSGKPERVERWLGSAPQYIAEKTNFPTLIVPPL